MILPAKVDLASLGQQTAIISSIILKNCTGFLVSLPNGEKRATWININSKNLRQVINEYRKGLERYRDFVYAPRAQQLYDWIIRALAADLEALEMITLVFIQDGILHIPMAALDDGEKLLVQKYAIATTPSLTLIHSKNTIRKPQALVLGLTKQATVNGRKFPALTNVDK